MGCYPLSLVLGFTSGRLTTQDSKHLSRHEQWHSSARPKLGEQRSAKVGQDSAQCLGAHDLHVHIKQGVTARVPLALRSPWQSHAVWYRSPCPET